MIKKETIQSLAQERIEELGEDLFVIDIQINEGNNIHVEIDHMNRGVGIAECASVSRNIEHNLDREHEDFSIQVTSPGLSNPFKVPQQYFKNIGRNVEVVVEGVKQVGKLTEADADGFTIEITTKEKVEGKKKKQEITREYKYEILPTISSRLYPSYYYLMILFLLLLLCL